MFTKRFAARMAALVAFALISIVSLGRAHATIDGNNFFIYPVQHQQTGGVEAYVKGVGFDGFGSMPLNAALKQAFGAVTTTAVGAYTRNSKGQLVVSPRRNVNFAHGIKVTSTEPTFDKGRMTLSATLDVRSVTRDVKRGRLSPTEGLTKIRAAVVSALGTARLYAGGSNKASMKLKVKGMSGLSWTGNAGIRVPANPRKAYNLKRPDRRERSFRFQSKRDAWN